MTKVFIGVDPRKMSATIEVVDHREPDATTDPTNPEDRCSYRWLTTEGSRYVAPSSRTDHVHSKQMRTLGERRPDGRSDGRIIGDYRVFAAQRRDRLLVRRS